MEKTVAFHTLGCRVNQSETASLAALFKARGYRVVDWGTVAGVYVINTCTVTGTGDKKSRQVIRQAVRANPAAVVVVTGCYAQTAPEEIARLPGVNLVVGQVDRNRLVDLAEAAVPGPPRVLTGSRDVFCELPVPAGDRTRAFLKVQEGCNRFCTYCIVPLARGRERSLPPDRVLAQARTLAASGHREIVVTGTNTGAYGRDLGNIDLAGLMEALAGVEGLARIRLSSVEPEEVTERLIAVLAGAGKFCRHLHLPLQSGDDAVLQAMGRRYTAAGFARLVRSLKAAVKGLAITADVMAGFPGEDRAAHLNTLALVEGEELAGLHVFKYSPRKGTAAYSYADQVDPGTREERSRELLAAGERLAHRFASSLIGREARVLVEEAAADGLYTGFTDTYVRVFFPGGPRGRVATVAVAGWGPLGLTGRILGG
ncbi:MAG: tRNA (N(6)-L-threonylcarbamoyladenosine(37)-C(2))-methylthiotransferase MtaB [Peptococcaceae bacterium]|nr:tRNA (N(6)-L-threonylcarbamoyladenosine(37)-C(2))-methylthiotransferase MtaB [Peptococcaceae bacterium]